MAETRPLSVDPDPATAWRFDVKVDGEDIGSFTACDGLSAEYDVFEYQEGGENGYIHRLPGRLKYGNVKLTRPVDAKSDSAATSGLAAWFTRLKSSVTRRTASITAFDAQGNKVAQWSLVDVYPARWTGPSFSSDGNSVPKETLELAHHGFIG
jgi:phage tail-like protein